MITIFEHHVFLCEINTGKHSRELGRKHRKREPDIADWGERERT
jgi:hypothetical protein